LSGLLAMTLPLVVARLAKSADAISVGTGDCRASLAMTKSKGARNDKKRFIG